MAPRVLEATRRTTRVAHRDARRSSDFAGLWAGPADASRLPDGARRSRHERRDHHLPNLGQSVCGDASSCDRRGRARERRGAHGDARGPRLGASRGRGTRPRAALRASGRTPRVEERARASRQTRHRARAPRGGSRSAGGPSRARRAAPGSARSGVSPDRSMDRRRRGAGEHFGARVRPCSPR